MGFLRKEGSMAQIPHKYARWKLILFDSLLTS